MLTIIKKIQQQNKSINAKIISKDEKKIMRRRKKKIFKKNYIESTIYIFQFILKHKTNFVFLFGRAKGWDCYAKNGVGI